MFADSRLPAALALALLGAAPLPAAAGAPCADEQVAAAVRTAIETRIGRRAEVTLDSFTCVLTAAAERGLAATPDPLARTGKAIRFALVTKINGPRGRAVRLGEAQAVVRLEAEHVRVRAALPPGSVLAAGDLETVTGPLDNLALRRMPGMEELVGARLTRALAGGQVVPADAVVAPPAVKFGDQVQLTVRHGGVEATVLAVAEQNAAVGKIIRVVNASSRRPLRARVTAPGEVEVVNER